MYFSQRFDSGGGQFMAEVWNRSRQNGDLSDPDYFDALDALLRRGAIAWPNPGSSIRDQSIRMY